MHEGGGIISFFLGILRSMDNIINETIRVLVGDFKISALVILLAVAFIYGILHSIGPGHGKTLVASFFLKEKHPLRKSLILAAIISAIHSGSAIILSFLLYFVLTGIRGMFKIQLQSYFMAVSGIFIVVIGVLFLILKIVKKDHAKLDEKVKDENIKNDKRKNRNLILIGISAGIVPCPAALMLMLFTLSQGKIYIGLLAVLSISLGMFFLLTIIGLISIKSRDGILFVSGKLTKKTETISTVLEFVSIGLIILIGLSMSSGIILNMLG